MSVKVLVSDPLNQSAVDRLTGAGIEVAVITDRDEDGLCAIIGEYDGIIIRSGTDVTARVIESGTKLRVIGRAGVGVDNIDIDQATRRGIAVINTPDANTTSAAEHTVSMLMALSRNIPQACAALKRGEWKRSDFVGQEIRGKTLGVVGMGKIGREVARRCYALDMRIIAYDPLVAEETAVRVGATLVDTLEELFPIVDYLTFHVPHIDATHHLLNTATLAQCKEGVRIINCARGGIVDEYALLEALDSGHVAGAALDVFETEPPDPNHPLIAHRHVVVTPHLGASTQEAQYNVAIQIADLVADALIRNDIKNAVNMIPVDAETYEAARPYLELAERIGVIQSQLAGSAHPTSITVEYCGEALDHPTALITAAVLKGMLSELTPGTVNLVNSPLLAQERGIRVTEIRSTGGEDFLNLITVTYDGKAKSGGEQYTRSISASIFGTDQMRLVRVNDLVCEAIPEGHMVFLWNKDVPGVIGKVGMTFFEHGINIASMSWQRQSHGGLALVILNIDGPIPDGVISDLESLVSVDHVRRVTLPAADTPKSHQTTGEKNG